LPCILRHAEVKKNSFVGFLWYCYRVCSDTAGYLGLG
jgi:hypothetical protein